MEETGSVEQCVEIRSICDWLTETLAVVHRLQPVRARILVAIKIVTVHSRLTHSAEIKKIIFLPLKMILYSYYCYNQNKIFPHENPD